MSKAVNIISACVSTCLTVTLEEGTLICTRYKYTILKEELVKYLACISLIDIDKWVPFNILLSIGLNILFR